MNKEEFITELGKKIRGLPERDREERLSFYREMIDDKIEDGIPEETAVAEVGSIDKVVSQIMSEIPFSRLIKEKVRPKRSLKAWEIILIILGAPLWFSLLVAFCAVVFSLYVTLFALLISVYAIVISFAGGVIFSIFETVYYFIIGNSVGGLFFIGAVFILIALSIISFFACKKATTGVLVFTKKMLLVLKSMFVKKEA